MIEPYERPLFALAYAVLKNAADAEEVVQEALMKAYQNLDQLRQDERFKSWLLRIAANEARMRKRRDLKFKFEPLEEVSAPDETKHVPRQIADWRELPSEFMEMAELRAAVRDAIENLPENYREVYVLSDNQHLSMEEIAGMLGIGVGAVKSRLQRARLRIQEHLGPKFHWTWKDRIQMLKGMNHGFLQESDSGVV
ncbi:MAG: RNA polymerase sigma factor [Bryobacteraceae bacterium]